MDNMARYFDSRRMLLLLLCMEIMVQAAPSLADDVARTSVAPKVETAQAASGQVYALINGKPVSVQEYRALLTETMRNRFYHGQAPEGQADAVRKEVGDLLIERVLLIEEAEKRGIQPDAAAIEKTVSALDARYAKSPEWKKQREQALPGFKARVEQQNRLDQLERQARNVPPPAEEEVRAYYNQNTGLFTEPESMRMSVILLKVDPSSPKAAWEKAHKQAQQIHERIRGGADFAEEARLHSNDMTASRGGDLGYIHRGMLPEALHEKIDKFSIGVVSEPIVLLEGIALFRLDERVTPKVREFAEVRQRATELLKREQQERAWRELNSRLRGAATIQILMPLDGEAN